MAKIVVIDDEPSILHAFRRAFDDPDDVLLTAPDAEEGLALISREQPDVVVLDLNLPDAYGLDVYGEIRAIDARIPVIFITGHGTTETAIEAMKQGAFDYLLKPLELPQVRDLVERAAEISRLGRVPAVIPDEDVPAGTAADVLVGRSPALQGVYNACGRRAHRDIGALSWGGSPRSGAWGATRPIAL